MPAWAEPLRECSLNRVTGADGQRALTKDLWAFSPDEPERPAALFGRAPRQYLLAGAGTRRSKVLHDFLMGLVDLSPVGLECAINESATIYPYVRFFLEFDFKFTKATAPDKATAEMLAEEKVLSFCRQFNTLLDVKRYFPPEVKRIPGVVVLRDRHGARSADGGYKVGYHIVAPGVMVATENFRRLLRLMELVGFEKLWDDGPTKQLTLRLPFTRKSAGGTMYEPVLFVVGQGEPAYFSSPWEFAHYFGDGRVYPFARGQPFSLLGIVPDVAGQMLDPAWYGGLLLLDPRAELHTCGYDPRQLEDDPDDEPRQPPFFARDVIEGNLAVTEPVYASRYGSCVDCPFGYVIRVEHAAPAGDGSRVLNPDVYTWLVFDRRAEEGTLVTTERFDVSPLPEDRKRTRPFSLIRHRAGVDNDAVVPRLLVDESLMKHLPGEYFMTPSAAVVKVDKETRRVSLPSRRIIPRWDHRGMLEHILAEAGQLHVNANATQWNDETTYLDTIPANTYRVTMATFEHGLVGPDGHFHDWERIKAYTRIATQPGLVTFVNVTAPCSAGKSYLARSMARDARRVLWIAPRCTLVRDTHNAFMRETGLADRLQAARQRVQELAGASAADRAAGERAAAERRLRTARQQLEGMSVAEREAEDRAAAERVATERAAAERELTSVKQACAAIRHYADPVDEQDPEKSTFVPPDQERAGLDCRVLVITPHSLHRLLGSDKRLRWFPDVIVWDEVNTSMAEMQSALFDRVRRTAEVVLGQMVVGPQHGVLVVAMDGDERPQNVVFNHAKYVPWSLLVDSGIKWVRFVNLCYDGVYPAARQQRHMVFIPSEDAWLTEFMDQTKAMLDSELVRAEDMFDQRCVIVGYISSKKKLLEVRDRLRAEFGDRAPIYCDTRDRKDVTGFTNVLEPERTGVNEKLYDRTARIFLYTTTLNVGVDIAPAKDADRQSVVWAVFAMPESSPGLRIPIDAHRQAVERAREFHVMFVCPVQPAAEREWWKQSMAQCGIAHTIDDYVHLSTTQKLRAVLRSDADIVPNGQLHYMYDALVEQPLTNVMRSTYPEIANQASVASMSRLLMARAVEEGYEVSVREKEQQDEEAPVAMAADEEEAAAESQANVERTAEIQLDAHKGEPTGMLADILRYALANEDERTLARESAHLHGWFDDPRTPQNLLVLHKMDMLGDLELQKRSLNDTIGRIAMANTVLMKTRGVEKPYRLAPIVRELYALMPLMDADGNVDYEALSDENSVRALELLAENRDLFAADKHHRVNKPAWDAVFLRPDPRTIKSNIVALMAHTFNYCFGRWPFFDVGRRHDASRVSSRNRQVLVSTRFDDNLWRSFLGVYALWSDAMHANRTANVSPMCTCLAQRNEPPYLARAHQEDVWRRTIWPAEQALRDAVPRNLAADERENELRARYAELAEGRPPKLENAVRKRDRATNE